MRIIPFVLVLAFTCQVVVGDEEAKDVIAPEEQARMIKLIKGDLSVATNEIERFTGLGRAAKKAMDEGRIDEARELAIELEVLTPKYTNSWNYGNAVQAFNQVLGRIALAEGDMDEAKTRLLASANSKGSPQMNSFGPNMQLAKELLEHGEKDVVLQYFERCLKFWFMGKAQVAKWTESVKGDQIPDFGANLVY